ncbi:MAG TPA: phosphodiester glycosidase family protein [Chitinophagaceae bacterium]|nr:phosphodiester glycosidase family protein [Chitinophagaceae bacterium]
MLFKKIINYSLLIISSIGAFAQVKWINVDSSYQPLPASVHVFKTTDSLDGKPNIAYYVIADLKDKKLLFDADTTLNRRFTPSQFYRKNDQPLVVVNTTFFSFQTNQNLNVVIKDGMLVGYNIHSIPGRGNDTLTYRHPFGSAIGISKNRDADIGWIFTDSALKFPYAMQWSMDAIKDSVIRHDLNYLDHQTSVITRPHKGTLTSSLRKWKMETAVGGGPVVLQAGETKITNNEELKFAGTAINDKHPRTAMGYTKDNKLIILVVQGRFPGIAEGATLGQEAKMLKDLGCWEALNLDGGGSSCMLVNGKETIKPSDATGQRAVPAVFIIKNK